MEMTVRTLGLKGHNLRNTSSVVPFYLLSGFVCTCVQGVSIVNKDNCVNVWIVLKYYAIFRCFHVNKINVIG